jgi:hypothetical protein
MPTWILDLNNISGGSDGEQLAGCCIRQNGQTYQFTQPNANPLSTAGPPLPAGVFPFPPFNYQSIEGWSIISNPLVPGQNALGTWIVPATAVLPEQTGTYTAIYVDDSANS